MAKQLNVDLNFRANTTQAQQQISSLQASLTKLGYSNALNINDASIQKASAAARELQLHLNRAINVETGKLDLSKFNASLTSANKNLSSLTKDLASGGELGQKAFKNITQAIADAEQPTISLNKQMTTLWTTMKNTLRWQISSSVLSQMMSTVQNAYSYVQKLDKSLNDIRIVSGLSADEMADFAERANEAAKALSTTTTKYADAALIFYQQGLSDKEVEERTNATIKMANVTGEAVDDVSSYMTAVWNNFNKDGTQSVEHFGDVMTKLGADTAASTEEIAGGLEKFAAVADTIGLSFDYATAAITTIVDRTRQSEDVVGTALKTIFSRIQGLKQGETLDDGTDLNQYSEALANVGIGIKDANDELRDMDEILDDIGERWDSLDRANKVALAQKVAGIRQYTQFMALFDNWEYMEQNLDIAYNADGTLEEQSEIYAESWEAARNRVKAAAQEIYSALLDKDFFISFDNALADTLTGVADFIEQIGGVKSILIGIGTVFMALIKDKITPGLQSVKKNIMILTGSMDKVYADIQNKNAQRIEEQIASGNYTRLQETELRNTALLSTTKEKLALTARSLTTEEEAAANVAIEGLKFQQDELLETTAKVEQLKKATEASQKAYQNATSKTNLNTFASLEQQMSNRKNVRVEGKTANVVSNTYGFGAQTVQALGSSIKTGLNTDYNSQKVAYESFVQAKIVNDEKIINSTFNVENAFKNTNVALDGFVTKLENKLNSSSAGSSGTFEYFTNFGKDYKMLESTMNASLKSFPSVIMEMEEVQKAKEKLNNTFNTAITPNQKNTTAIINAYKELLNIIRQVELSGEDLGKVLEQSGSLPTGFLERLLKQLKEIAETEEEVKTQAESIQTAVDDLDFSHTINGGEAFGSLMQAAGSASMAIFSFQSLIDTLNDTDATFVEKLSSGLMSISMLGPSLIGAATGATTAGRWLGELVTTINAINAAEKTLQETENINAVADQIIAATNAAAIKVQSHTKDVLNEEYEKELFLRELINQGLSEEAAKRVMDAQATMGQAGAYHQLNQELGQKRNGAFKTIKDLKTPFIAALPYIVAVGAAIAAVSFVIFKLYQYTHKARKELEQANEELATAKENYDNLKSSIDEVNTSLSNLDSQYDSLHELTYGTSEWQSKLYEVNEEIQDIIDKYDLLKDTDFYRDSEGVLHITDEGKEKIEEKNKISLRNSQYAVAAAENTANKAETAALREEVLYTSKYKSTKVNSTSVKSSDRANRAKYGNNKTVNNLITEAQEAEKTGQRKATSAKNEDHSYRRTYKTDTYNAYNTPSQTISKVNLSSDQLDSTVEILKKAVEEGKGPTKWSSAEDLVAAGVDKNVAELIASNSNLQDAVKQLTIATDSNTEAYAQKLANVISGDDRYLDKFKNVDKEYQSGLLDTFSQDVANMVDSIYKNITIDEDIKKEYAEASNYSYQNGKFYAKDENGNAKLDEEVSVTDTVLQKYEAQQQAIDKCTDSYKEYKAAVEASKKVWAAADKIKDSYDKNKDSIKDLQKAQKAYSAAQEKVSKESTGRNKKERDAAKKKYDEAIKANNEYLKVVKENAAELLNISEETAEKVFTDDFIAENSELIEDAIDGDIEALDRLGEKTFVANIVAEFSGSDEVKTEVEALATELADYSDQYHLVIGATLDNTELDQKCSELVAKMGWTADQAKEKLAELGYDVEPITEPITQKVTTGAWVIDPGSVLPGGTITQEPKWFTASNELVTGQAVAVKVKTYNGKTYGGNVISRNTTNSGKTGGTTGSSTGSDSKATKKDTKDYKQLSEIKERYHDVNRELERQETLLDKLSKQTDNAYGVAKLQSYNRELKSINKQITIQNRKLAEAQKWQKKDLAKLTNKVHKTTEGNYTGLGLNVKTDKSTGEITNYSAVMKKIDNDMDAATKKYNDYIKKYNAMSKDEQEKAEDTLEKQEKAYEKAEALYDARVEAVNQYEETLDTINKIIEAAEEARQEWLSKNFEKITYKVEYKLEINEADIALIEHSFDKISEQTYKRAEAIGLIWSSLGKGDEISKTAEKIAVYQDEYKELTDAYSKGQISQADFISGMGDLRDGALDTAEAIKELDEQMLEYYSDTLSMVSEEISKYTNGIDSVSSSLEHYLSIMDLLGKSKEYDQINEINNALSKTAKSKFDVATKTYTMYEKQQETAKKSLDDYKKTFKGTYEDLMNDAQYQALAKNYDAITEKTREAYDEQLTAAEDYFSTLKTIYENEIDQMTEKLLDAFTNGIGMDALQDNMSKISTNWSEYLTPVNQAYELSKLQRQVNQDIEKTNNAAAKKRYKDYSDEIDQLKDKTELSNLELEIAQAKYKQLQAQIALEEAQNAKSTVRLSRDSEGNYGYVYTADKDAIADAEQTLDDANNDLYNIALKARNDYGEKVVELEQEMMEALAEAEKEYVDDKTTLEKRKTEIVEYYGNLMTTYSNLFRIAGETDARAIDDAWVHTYDSIIEKGENWKDDTTKQTTAATTAWTKYSTATSAIYTQLGLDSDNYKAKVSDLVAQEEALATEATTKTIPTLEKMATAVLSTATAYAKARDSVLGYVTALEGIAEKSQTDITKAANTETVDASAYNKWVTLMAANKGIYSNSDQYGVMHFSNSEKSLTNYITKANSKGTPDATVIKWNNSVATEMMNKHGYFAFDSSGKLHYTTNTDKDKAKAFFEKLGISNATLQTFDTGGYTGSWGQSGKLAMLHEKELVLNSDDTKNFLAGINILRDIVQAIDLQAMYASNTTIAASGVASANRTFAQEVSIHAEFPNAVNHNEIEQAFDSLINRAAQYVNRK